MSVDYVKANPDIVQESKDLVLTQFGESDNIQKFVEIIAEEAKTYEEVAEKIFTSFLLINATGFALDSIGEFLNFPREGRGDDAYRTALVISAIGANSSITRDSIYRLVEIVTGGLGGYFYNGRYHDLYIYLQDACVERTIAAEFLDKYLPANTQASVLFESGEAFGFENNDRAKGFSKVYQQAAEGDAYVKLSESIVSSDIAPVLPRAFEFVGSDTYTYRTEFEADLSQRVRAISWVIPDTYLVGDVITITARNNSTRELFQDSLTLTSSGTGAYLEIIPFVSDFFVNNGIVDLINVVTDSPSVYIGIESGLTPPIADPRIVGFDNDYTIIFDAKDKSGLDYYSRVSLINKTKGEIPVSWGMSFEPSGTVDFTIDTVQAGAQFGNGFGDIGLVIVDESFEEAGGFCTRVSLTSRDILGFGTLQEPETFEYELDSKLLETATFTPTDTITAKALQTVSPHTHFRAPLWDATLSAAPDPLSYGLALRSPGALANYRPVVTKQFRDDQLTKLSNLEIDREISDINLPSSLFYFEVSFPKLPQSPAANDLMFSKTFVSPRMSEGSTGVSALTLTAYCQYNSGTADYTLGVKFEQTNIKIEGVGESTQTVTEFYSIKAEPYAQTLADLSSLDGTTFGFLTDPLTNRFLLYVDGVEFDGLTGVVEVTDVGGTGAPSVSVGDLFSPIGISLTKGIFGVSGVTDNSQAEPTTLDDYGSVEFIYNRDDLKYTSQLPLNTVDIFGRKIN